jgi:hypothetical protein
MKVTASQFTYHPKVPIEKLLNLASDCIRDGQVIYSPNTKGTKNISGDEIEASSGRLLDSDQLYRGMIGDTEAIG